MEFRLQAPFEPAGDQPEAIRSLLEGLRDGRREQVLMGVTGSGKTFTMANVIQRVQKPTLVISHNKTLAAQLYSEFREFFPINAVHYFVSYYDYYQPEAYIPQSVHVLVMVVQVVMVFAEWGVSLSVLLSRRVLLWQQPC